MESASGAGSPIPAPRMVGRQKRDFDAKKFANPTLLQLGQTVARGDNHSRAEIAALPTSSSNNQYAGSTGKKRGSARDAPRTLDGFLLLDWCRARRVDGLFSKDEAEQGHDPCFSTMLHLQAPLEPFGCLPALVELDFQCNALQTLVLGNGFQNLEVLNLSFNCLSSKDVEELSNLLRIRELYLGSNRIRSLPPIMDRFSHLETLSLERNNISGQEVFSFLSIVPRLRNLNLSYNKLTGFPESALTLEGKRGAAFYNLIYLNLAHNLIADEAGVVYTNELKNLRKLILYGNPLAHAAVTSYDPTKLTYDPVPTLTALLSERSSERQPVTVVAAYPGTKKKKLHSMSCYERVEIYKMIPNEVVLQPVFRTRAAEFLVGNNPDTITDKELLAKKQVTNLNRGWTSEVNQRQLTDDFGVVLRLRSTRESLWKAYVQRTVLQSRSRAVSRA
ncbi:hypothetical protein BBJ28_00015229 [Nothophytophthora sp. Chile5]|nr:hypothetical protein BBJ28_00015229 [Nothophytophthora sp. Chile5]